MQRMEDVRFGRDKAGYSSRNVTNKYGDLYLDGVKLLDNMPFALLQSKRNQLRRSGIVKKRIRIKYHLFN